MKQIHVMAGAIADDLGRVLVARRPDHVHQGGLWEFPGGKLEPGETPEQGLARELAEELGITVFASRPLIRIHHDYGDRHVLLDVRRVDTYAGRPSGLEGQPVDWLDPTAMDPARFPAADRPIIMALRLPQLYLITGADGRGQPGLLARLERALDSGIKVVQLRAHGLDREAYAELSRRVFDLCERRSARLILNRSPEEAQVLPRHGIHLTARLLHALGKRPARLDDLIGASCHGEEELTLASALGLDYALLSPVQATRSHPDAKPLGWARFAELVGPQSLPVYALGGLAPTDLGDAIHHGAQGVAAVRGFWPE